jgi:hypothetical protein
MNIFENNSSATDHYAHYSTSLQCSLAEKPQVVLHNGTKWEAVGESIHTDVSLGKHLLYIAAAVTMVAAAILLLCIPFFFMAYREAIADLFSGKPVSMCTISP